MVATRRVAMSNFVVRVGGIGTLCCLKKALILGIGHVNMAAFSLPSSSVSVGLMRLLEARLPARPTLANELACEVGGGSLTLEDFFEGICLLSSKFGFTLATKLDLVDDVPES
jgi:hypothetical protein